MEFFLTKKHLDQAKWKARPGGKKKKQMHLNRQENKISINYRNIYKLWKYKL